MTFSMFTCWGANVVQPRNIKKSSLELVHAPLKAARKLRNTVCLLSSQVLLSSLLEEILKLVEVHQLFLKHNWLHDIKLGDQTALQRSLEVVCFHAL